MTDPQFASVPVDKIDPCPYNPRHEAVDIEGLAASIAEVGVIEPLVLSRHGKGRFTVVCGSRRLAASRLAGLSDVPAIVLPTTGEQSQRAISLVENLHRRDMTHIEQGEAFLALAKTGLSQLRIAKMVGVSDATVSFKLTLVRKLIPEFQDLIHRDSMAVSEGMKMAKLSPEAQREVFAARGKTRPSKVKLHRRPNAEACLMRALSSFREGDFVLALAEAERAVGYLKSGEKHTRPEPAVKTGRVTPVPACPAEVPSDGRLRCPHCMDRVTARIGQTPDEALAEHGEDRPFCRAKIRELVSA